MTKPIDRAVLDESLNWYSDTVSKAVRTVAFGTIAGVWAVLTADRLTLTDTIAFGWSTSIVVTAAFVFSSFALLADIVQYVAAYKMTDIGIDRWEDKDSKGEPVEFYYDKVNLGRWGYFLYQLNYRLFRVKFALAILAGTAFVIFAFAIRLTGPH